MRLEITSFENIVTLKPGLGVTEGRWKWHHSVDWYGFLLVTLSLRRAVFEIFDL